MIRLKSVITSVAFSLIFCGLTVSCNTSYDSMLGEYNGCFELKTQQKNIPKVGEPGFNEKDMIRDSYDIIKTRGIIIVAPSGGTEYVWTIEGEEKKFKGQILNYKPSESMEVYVPHEVTLDVIHNPDYYTVHTYQAKSVFKLY